MTTLEGVVVAAFSLANTFRIIAYVPQIIRLASDPGAVRGVACSTWAMFLASHLATVAYAIVVARDIAMAVVFLGNATACAAIVGLVVWRRSQIPTLTLGTPI